MKAIQHTLELLFFASFLLISGMLKGQGSVTATYTDGDIPTGFLSGGNWDPACNGSSTVLSVNLPSGFQYEVTSIDISYDFVANPNLWMAGQNSQIHFQNTNTTEATVSEGTGDMPGTQSYSRLNVGIANGTYPGGTDLNFEMRAWRDYTTGAPGCSTTTGNIANNTWTITVHYGPEITPPRVGINTTTPKATLDVEGVVKVGDDPSIYSAPNQPQPGMIRWDSQNQDFVGYDGSEWKSLTQKKTQEIYIPGVAFFPKNANSDYSFLETFPASGDYHYLGRSSSVVLIYPISLPVGSVINSVTFFYLDRYTNVDITFSINSNSYNSSIENTIWQANSTGVSPTIRSISAFPNNYVSTSYFYYLQALYTQPVNTKFLGIKGVRINYTLP